MWLRTLIPGFVLGFAMVSAIGLSDGSAQPFGKGKKGQGGDPAFMADKTTFHYLLDSRESIQRTIKKLDNGVETVTVSAKPEVVKRIQEHAHAMHKRVKEGKGIHMRDPLFAEIFANYDKITMKVENIDKGVKVTETSEVPHVARLIQAHAEVVSKFIKNGYDEVHQNHPVPEKPKLDKK